MIIHGNLFPFYREYSVFLLLFFFFLKYYAQITTYFLIKEEEVLVYFGVPREPTCNALASTVGHNKV